MILLKNANVFISGNFIENDILFGEQIEDVGKNLDMKRARTLDAKGMTVVPGFIDLHNHFDGAGGEGGPSMRTIPISADVLLRSGITTAVGLFGTDGYTRSVTDLLLHARKLKDTVDTFVYTGSYQIPGPTMTGSVAKDIILVPEVVGVKIALSDHRSSYPDRASLLKTVTEVRVSSILAGKPGIIMTHMGNGKLMFDPIYDITDNTDVPIKQFLPTHINRNAELLEASVEFAKRGGFLDITAGECRKTMESIKYLISKGVKLEHLTVSTDCNGSLPVFDSEGKLKSIEISPCNTLLKILVHAMREEKGMVNNVLEAISENPANRLNVKKGKIEKGYDADLLVFEKDLNMKYVISRGRLSAI